MNENELVVYEEYGDLLQKWLKYLLYIHIVGIVCTLLAGIPVLSVISGWVSTAVLAADAYVLYQIAPACGRYRKAAIFNVVVLVAGLLAKSILSLVISICSIVAMYQEYQGHSEIVAQRNPALSGKWNSLFHYQLFAGIISGVAGSAGVVIGVLAQMDSDALVKLIVLILTGVTLILELIYLSYLNQTVKAFEA